MKVLDANLQPGYLCSSDTLTFVDIMVYIEISQILGMFRVYITNTKAEAFRAKLKENPEWEEEDELKEYPSLAEWYNKIMKSCEAYKTIKGLD